MDTTSPIARLCPAARLLLLVLAFGWMLLFSAPLPAMLPFAVGLAAVITARGLPRLRALLPFLLTLAAMTVLIWTLMTPGGTLLTQLGPMRISQEGLAYGAAMALRITAMLLAGIAFLAVTPIEELRLGICQLGVPYPVAFAIGLAFRLVPVFTAMLQTTVQAQQIRGLSLDEGNAFQRFRKYAPLMIPVIVLSLRNTDQLAMALAARGYGRPGPRTTALHYPWRLYDTLVVITGVLVPVVTVLVQHAIW